MNWTAEQLETVLGMTFVTLINGVITEGTGLDLATANARLQLCLVANKLPPDAEAYQVRAWMIRNGIDLSTIPAVITSTVPAGPALEEALMRWEHAVRIPKDHPLVAVVSAGLGVTVDSVWWDILDL